MSRTAAVRAAVVPGWLAEVVRPRRAPVPWPEMIRAALAICVPLSAAALLPFGRSRNYGLLSTFLTPLVVVLIDLLGPAGWRLAEDRLVDTLAGCAIALLAGFAPWPMAWYSHLPRQYEQTVQDMCRYLEEVLGHPGSGVSSRARRRRPTCRTTRSSSRSARRSGPCSACSAPGSGLPCRDRGT